MVVVVVGSNALLGHSHVRLGCDNIVIWFTSTIIPQFSHATLVPQRCEKYEGPDPWKMSNLLRSFRLPHFYETSIPHKFQEVKIDSRKCRVGLAAIRDKPNV